MLNQNDFTDRDGIMAPEYRSNWSGFEGSCMDEEISLRTFADSE